MNKHKLLKEYENKMLLAVSTADQKVTQKRLEEADQVLNKIYEVDSEYLLAKESKKGPQQ